MELSTSNGHRLLIQAIVERYRADRDSVVIIGIAGAVASGKSRFTKSVIDALALTPSIQTLQLPLELWINRAAFDTGIYADRFYLEELRAALGAIRANQLWLCPRFDLIKLFKRDPSRAPAQLTFESSEVTWNRWRYRKVASTHDLPDLPGAAGVYAEAETGRLFSLFLPKKGLVYLVDGTMVYADEIMRPHYDHRVYVTAPWVVRIARMIRRYNRHEVFGSTAKSELEYVGFLVEEARSCADREIETQRAAATLTVASNAETISNILDLYYLKQRLTSAGYDAAYQLSENEVDETINRELESLASITDPEALAALRAELDHLIESKHLLVLENSDLLLSRLYQLILH